jgi:membrane-associated phospholipid phosphatase
MHSRLPALVLPTALAALLLCGIARADSSPYKVHAVDGLITSGAWVGSALFSLLPVDTTNRWDHEPFSFDHAVRGGLAPAAARVSDLLLWSSMTTPIVALLADHADPATAEAILIYAETLAINSLLTGAAKYLVQRPRPYLYDRSPAVQAYARSSGRGGQLSFFSGHSSIAFASAVAGAQLFAVRSRSTAARAAVWGIELAFAAATANLRVRAGQHYYSDVVVGSIVVQRWVSRCATALALSRSLPSGTCRMGRDGARPRRWHSRQPAAPLRSDWRTRAAPGEQAWTLVARPHPAARGRRGDCGLRARTLACMGHRARPCSPRQGCGVRFDLA